MHILEEKIRNANSAGRIAVIPFITAGFPDKETFWQVLEEIDQCGADIIEIGVPFSDPVADGPVVEDASRRVLEAGVNLEWTLAGLRERKGKYKAALVLMGYFNPFLQYGIEKLALDALAADIAGIIIPDLPFEESGEIKKIFHDRGLALVPLVGPNTPPERMALYAKDAMGYVYAVSVMGVTGEREKLAESVAATIRRARDAFAIPVALGFGLREPSQVEILPPDARPSAAVIGSALLKHIDSGKKAEEFLKRWL